MKVFTNDFEDRLVSIIGTVLVVIIVLLVFGVVGGLEQGLIGR
mgnify:FL=1|jgi:hypothetical protein